MTKIYTATINPGMKKYLIVLISLTVILLVGVLDMLGLIQKLEFITLDLRYQVRKECFPKPSSPSLVFVKIDDASLGDLGAWPFPRAVHADIIELLSHKQPNTVVYDIFFTEPTNSDADESRFVTAAESLPHFVSAAAEDNDHTRRPLLPQDVGPTRPFVHVLGDSSHLATFDDALLPYKDLAKHTYFGFAEADSSLDGVRRNVSAIVRYNGYVYPGLALQTLLLYSKIDPDSVVIHCGKEISIPGKNGRLIHIPIDESGQMLVNFRHTVEDFHPIGFSDLGIGLNNEIYPDHASPRRVVLPQLQDKIVAIGFTGTGFDTGPIPLAKFSPLTVVQLNALDNLLQEDFLKKLSIVYWLPAYGLVLLFGLIFVQRVSCISGLLFWPAAWGIMIALALFLFTKNWWFPIASPSCGIFLCFFVSIMDYYFGESREKLRIRKTLSPFLSEKVLKELLDSGVILGGATRTISIMFCDIRGYTTYCDNRDPQDALHMLNEYLEAMTEVIFKYDGTLDKYIGDCIMAFWGAPQDQPDHAQRAVCAAIEMRYALAKFKPKQLSTDSHTFECGIGIHTGEACVGITGSSRLVNYTAIGSSVNLAARLETLTKRFNCRILISEATLKYLQGDFVITALGTVQIPGFSSPTNIFSVEAYQDITSALAVTQTLTERSEYTAEDASEPIWKPAPLPDDAT